MLKLSIPLRIANIVCYCKNIFVYGLLFNCPIQGKFNASLSCLEGPPSGFSAQLPTLQLVYFWSRYKFLQYVWPLRCILLRNSQNLHNPLILVLLIKFLAIWSRSLLGRTKKAVLPYFLSKGLSQTYTSKSTTTLRWLRTRLHFEA